MHSLELMVHTMDIADDDEPPAVIIQSEVVCREGAQASVL